MSEVELPSGWAPATLGDVASLIRGVTYKRDEISDKPANNRLALVRATNILDNELDLSDVLWVLSDRVEEHQHLRLGDLVLVASSGSINSVGRCAAVRQADGHTFGAFCSVVRSADPGVLPEFLSFFCQSPDVRRRWSTLARGTNINNLRRDHVTETPFVLPPTSEQQRIVDELERRFSHLDHAVAGLRSAMQSARRAKSAVLQELVTRPSLGHPVVEDQTTQLAQLSAETGREAEAVGSTLCPGGAVPVLTLGDLLLRIEAGKSYACEGRPAGEEEWGVVKVSAMSWGSFRERENKALPASVAPQAGLEIRPGDLLISRANTEALVGASVLVGQCRPKLVLSDKSLRLVAAPSVNPRWLQAALSSPHMRRQLSDRSTGTKESMRNVTQANIRAVTLPVPPRCVQDAVINEVERRLSLIDAAERTIEANLRKAEQLRRSLLHAAFTGKLVPQDPADEPASELLARVKSQREAQRAAAQAAKKKAPATVRSRRKKELSA